MSDSSEAIAQNSMVLSWDRIHKDCKSLSKLLKEKGETWHGIIAITRGGLVPAGIVARELGIKIIETIGISSYSDNETHQREINIIKFSNPALTGNGAGWLIIDDLVDSGNTLKVLNDILPNAYRATIYAKPAGESSTDIYLTEIPQDTWVYFPWEM